MSRFMKLINWFLGGLLLLLVIYGIDTANASGTDIEQTTKVIGGDSTAYGVGGLGDVDINDCLSSYQIFIFYQGVRVNPLCLADKLDVLGRHYEAAQMRCSMKAVRKVYGTKQDCVDAIQMNEIIETPDLEIYNQYAQAQEEEDDYRDEQIESLQQQLEEQRVLLEQRRRPRVVQSPAAAYWTDDRRAKLEAIKGEQ